jgi:uncharacterized membrane protein YqaE (UPF0057 family)
MSFEKVKRIPLSNTNRTVFSFFFLPPFFFFVFYRCYCHERTNLNDPSLSFSLSNLNKKETSKIKYQSMGEDRPDGCCHKSCGLCCAYFIPPLGVFWQYGCSCQFWLSVILTLCGWFPGVIYACCVIANDDGRD